MSELPKLTGIAPVAKTAEEFLRGAPAMEPLLSSANRADEELLGRPENPENPENLDKLGSPEIDESGLEVEYPDEAETETATATTQDIMRQQRAYPQPHSDSQYGIARKPVSGLAQDSPERIKLRIVYTLSAYPAISQAMLSAIFGWAVPSRMWRPVLEELIVKGIVVKEEIQMQSHIGQHRTITRFRLTAIKLPDPDVVFNSLAELVVNI